MGEDQLIQEIVHQVLRRLHQRQHKALCLFGGGSIGSVVARAELKKLVESNWEIKAAFTKKGAQVLGENWLCSELGGDIEIITEDSNPGLVLKEIDVIVIPVLTINTAAKLAHGIADNLVTTLVLEGLLAGKSIIAVRDACDLTNPVRAQLGMSRAPVLYQDMLTGNLRRLEEFGVKLTRARDLYQTLISLTQQNAESWDAQVSVKDGKVFMGRVLSYKDLMNWPEENIVVSNNTLITHLARDLAQDRRINIVREGAHLDGVAK